MKLNVKQALLRAKTHTRKGEHDQARQIYMDVINVFPGNNRAKRALAQLNRSERPIHMKKSLPQEALKELINLYNQRRFEDVAERTSNLVKEYPSSAVLWNLYGAANKSLSRLEEAVDGFQKAVQIDSNYPDAFNNLGVVLKTQGKLKEAINAYQKAIALKSDYADAHNNLGNALSDQDNFDDAIIEYQSAIAYKPEYAEAYFNLGRALKHQGKLDDAIESYKNALTIKPEFPEANNSLGIALQAQGKLEDAVHAYRRAIENERRYAEAYSNLGTLLFDHGRLNEALDATSKAISINPNLSKSYLNLGRILHKQGKIDAAIVAYNNALDKNPMDSETYTRLGSSFKSKGQLYKAAISYKKSFLLAQQQNELDEQLTPAINYVSLPYSAVDKEFTNILANFFDNYKVDKPKNARLWFAEANLQRHQGSLELAANTYKIANETKKIELGSEFTADIIPWTEYIQRIRRLPQLSKKSEDSNNLQLLLILGPSRSGKSTIEKLLAHSDEVIARYESIDTPLIEYFHKRYISHPNEISHKEIIKKLFYLDSFEDLNKPKLVTCTNPTVVRNLAFFEELIPNLKVIYVKREEKELLVDMYTTNYKSKNTYSYDIMRIFEHLKGYKAVMAAVDQKIGDRFLEITREDIFLNTEEVLKRISKFSGVSINTKIGVDYSIAQNDYYNKMFEYFCPTSEVGFDM